MTRATVDHVRAVVVAVLVTGCGRVDFERIDDVCFSAFRLSNAPYADTVDGSHLICTVEQLAELGRRREDWGGTFMLSGDIDVAELAGELPMIGDATAPFTGVFDGGGHTISNLVLDHPTVSDIGLFRNVGVATIRNLALVDVIVTGATNVGALIGYARSNSLLVEDIRVSGSIRGEGAVGGVAGNPVCYFNDGCLGQVFQRITAAPVTVVATDLFTGVGGIAGATYAEPSEPTPVFLDVTVDGVIEGDNYVGGIIGDAESFRIERARSSATIKARGSAGGIIGESVFLGSCLIVDSVTTGDVTCSEDDCGGAAGFLQGSATRVQSHGKVSCGGSDCGGLVGYMEGFCEQCVATGDVDGLDSVGGLFGMAYIGMREVTDSYSTGTVTGRDQVGGLLGSGAAKILRSYSVSNVSGTNDVGGLVGEHVTTAQGTSVTDCFTAGTVTGVAGANTVSSLVGRNTGGAPVASSYYAGTCTNSVGTCTEVGTMASATAAFYSPSTPPLTAWDFATVWSASSNGFPKLSAVPLGP